MMTTQKEDIRVCVVNGSKYEYIHTYHIDKADNSLV